MPKYSILSILSFVVLASYPERTHWCSQTIPPPMQGKHKEAERRFGRAVVICEQALGSGHPKVAIALNNQAGTLEAQVGDITSRGAPRWRDYLRVLRFLTG